jgi:transcriptional regulator of arginine metabolism
MRKRARQQFIRQLITHEPVRGQLELVDILRKAGFPVTQASVSRDLDELNIIKAEGHYVLPMRRSLSDPLSSVQLIPSGDNLIVAKCRSGLASAVAVTIDEAGIEDIAGTLAGDDTIFIAVGDARTQHNVMRRLWKLFEGSKLDGQGEQAIDERN